MATFQSIGVTPDGDQLGDKDFYRIGTKIELLMNRSDPRYEALQGIMYRFFHVRTVAENLNAMRLLLPSARTFSRRMGVLKRDLAKAALG